MKRDELEWAWDSVMMGSPGETVVCIHRPTGEWFVNSEAAGEHDIPDGADEDGDYVFLPDRYDLDLGRQLVNEFVLAEAPQLEREVQRAFSRRGGYGRYKALLQRKGLLEKWYEFESRRETEAMLEWAKENGITIEE